MMTRSDMSDLSKTSLGKTGEEATFDLAKMSSQEVAAELLRRHQAMRARAAMKRDLADTDDVVDLVDAEPPITLSPTIMSPISASPTSVPPTGVPQLPSTAVASGVSLPRPQAESRVTFGAIARLAGEQPAAGHSAPSHTAQDPMVPNHVVPNQDALGPVMPPQPADGQSGSDQSAIAQARLAPMMPAAADLPLRSLRAIGDLGGPAPRATPERPPVRHVPNGVAGKDRFATGFGWGVVTGAAAMVVLLAVEIALFPSLHLPARLHQLRGMIGPVASAGNAPGNSRDGTIPPAGSQASNAPAPTNPLPTAGTAALPTSTATSVPPPAKLPAAAPVAEQLPLETSSLVPDMDRPQPRLIASMPVAATAGPNSTAVVTALPTSTATTAAAAPLKTASKAAKPAAASTMAAPAPTPVLNRTKPRPVAPALAGGAKL